MPQTINEETLAKVARLARVSLTRDELLSMTVDIEKIIAYFEQIRKLNLDNVEPMTHAIAMTLNTRADQVNPTRCATQHLPYQKHNHFYVPAVLE